MGAQDCGVGKAGNLRVIVGSGVIGEAGKFKPTPAVKSCSLVGTERQRHREIREGKWTERVNTRTKTAYRKESLTKSVEPCWGPSFPQDTQNREELSQVQPGARSVRDRHC